MALHKFLKFCLFCRTSPCALVITTKNITCELNTLYIKSTERGKTECDTFYFVFCVIYKLENTPGVFMFRLVSMTMHGYHEPHQQKQ